MHQAGRKRVRLIWHPTWTPEIQSWTINQIRKNLWRFDRIETAQDVMQDAQLLFHVLEKKYPTVNQAAHFFALFKTSLLRMFIDKARRKQRSAIDQEINAEEASVEMHLTGTPNYGYFNLLLEEMPDELKTVLRALTDGRVRLRLNKPTKRHNYPRENHNMRLKRRLPSLTLTDPVGDLQRLLRYNT